MEQGTLFWPITWTNICACHCSAMQQTFDLEIVVHSHNYHKRHALHLPRLWHTNWYVMCIKYPRTVMVCQVKASHKVAIVCSAGTPRSWWRTLTWSMVQARVTKCVFSTFSCSLGSAPTTHTCLMAWNQVSYSIYLCDNMNPGELCHLPVWWHGARWIMSFIFLMSWGQVI